MCGFCSTPVLCSICIRLYILFLLLFPFFSRSIRCADASFIVISLVAPIYYSRLTPNALPLNSAPSANDKTPVMPNSNVCNTNTFNLNKSASKQCTNVSNCNSTSTAAAHTRNIIVKASVKPNGKYSGRDQHLNMATSNQRTKESTIRVK